MFENKNHKMNEMNKTRNEEQRNNKQKLGWTAGGGGENPRECACLLIPCDAVTPLLTRLEEKGNIKGKHKTKEIQKSQKKKP